MKMENQIVNIKQKRFNWPRIIIGVGVVFILIGILISFIPWNLNRFGDLGFSLAMLLFWATGFLPVAGLLLLFIVLLGFLFKRIKLGLIDLILLLIIVIFTPLLLYWYNYFSEFLSFWK